MFDNTKTPNPRARDREVMEIGHQEMIRVVGGDGHVKWHKPPDIGLTTSRAERWLAECRPNRQENLRA